MAVHRFFMPLPDPWRQTGILAAAALAPYSPKGNPPKVDNFVPTEKPPQHQLQMDEAIRELRRQLRGD